MALNKPHEALPLFIGALQIYENTSSDVDTGRNLASTLHAKGTCLLALNKPHEALQYYNRALPVYEKLHVMSTLTEILLSFCIEMVTADWT